MARVRRTQDIFKGPSPITKGQDLNFSLAMQVREPFLMFVPESTKQVIITNEF